MKRVYDMDDVFLAVAVIFISTAIAMKLFDVSWKFIFTTISPRHMFELGIVSLLFNMAVNIHESCREK